MLYETSPKVNGWDDLPVELKDHIPNFSGNKESTTCEEYFWDVFQNIIFNGDTLFPNDEFKDFRVEDFLDVDWYGVFASIQYIADERSYEEYDESNSNIVYMERARNRMLDLFPNNLDENGNPFGIPDPVTFE